MFSGLILAPNLLSQGCFWAKISRKQFPSCYLVRSSNRVGPGAVPGPGSGLGLAPPTQPNERIQPKKIRKKKQSIEKIEKMEKIYR